MNPVSKSQFLKSFLAVATSLVLVCGALLLLTSTSPWTSRQEAENEPWMAVLAHQAAEAEAAADNAVPAEMSEPEQPLTSKLSEEPNSSGGVDALVVPQVATTGTVDDEAESMIVSDGRPVPGSGVETQAEPETAAEGVEPETLAIDARPATTEQGGESPADPPPPAVASEAVNEPPGELAAASQETADGVATEASPEITGSVTPPPPTLRKRKPEVEPRAVSVKAAPPAPRQGHPTRQETAPKPEQAARTVAQQAPAQSRRGIGRWLPMALAPADKPVPSHVPTARPSNASYANKVWAALARHKPRAGQSGSATVVFSIGAGGALGGVRIGRSSGNTRLDQLALATVRSAAPFPPPPSGAASFSIRVDFH